MKRHEKQNILVTANAVEIAAGVIEKIAGNEISNHLNGELVRPSDLADAVTARLQTHFSRYMETA
jgi:hypothetical protein